MKEKRLMNIVPEVYERGAVFDGEFIVVEKTLKKDTAVGIHWHDYFELEIIVSGIEEVTYNNEKFIASRGNATLMSYCDFHALNHISDVVMINIRFFENSVGKEICDNLLSGIGKFNIKFDEDEIQKIIGCVNRIFEENEKKDKFYYQMSKSILNEIIIDVIRKSTKDSADSAPGTIQQAVNYIRKNFRYDISVESTAKHLKIAPNYFGSVFKKNIGVSFNDYVNTLRLKYACGLLENSDYSIKEIAYFSGFNSIEYFFFIFKKRLFTTPNAYRSTHSKKAKSRI
ncbi:AraC family transcriptional regulator [Qingrenia yutianensis]|uniref:Helix-turn-helix transcriptional regulator n=1 Tax=Qingrenia yutianensis TaxID=2763676 RepID=A0A926F422_9FIRM|nr:AraC family transcriptional regulator [Qingrenia yutianensis]MBC8595368.1 helix-turn-helix transcriptional regulator [Qingrenia yutianensis]